MKDHVVVAFCRGPMLFSREFLYKQMSQKQSNAIFGQLPRVSLHASDKRSRAPPPGHKISHRAERGLTYMEGKGDHPQPTSYQLGTADHLQPSYSNIFETSDFPVLFFQPTPENIPSPLWSTPKKAAFVVMSVLLDQRLEDVFERMPHLRGFEAARLLDFSSGDPEGK